MADETRTSSRWIDAATATVVALTVLMVGWFALVWFDPQLPVNPFPPPPVEETPAPGNAGGPAATPVARVAAAMVYQPSPTFPPTWTPTATGTATPTRRPTSTPFPTYTLTPTPTPYLLRPYTIVGMRTRRYPESQIELRGTYGRGEGFRSYLVRYKSDGLNISGMMNVPEGDGPFPVIVLCHGYIRPDQYATGDGSYRVADYLAQNGYLTLAPDYRGHAASENGRSFFHIGYAEDVLNAIAALPSVEQANPRKVGLWGHSMGGGVALKAAMVNKGVDALVLFGSVSADERTNYENGLGNGPGVYGIELLGSPRTNRVIYKLMSPIHYLRYSPPLSIHHGEADRIVPHEWSEELYQAARKQGVKAELHLYPEGKHTFADQDWELAMERTLAFFDRHVK
jgi:dienelactone hydrolase